MLHGQTPPPLSWGAHARFDTANGRVALAPLVGLLPGTAGPFVDRCDSDRFVIGTGEMNAIVRFAPPGAEGRTLSLWAIDTMFDAASGAVIGGFVTRDENTFTVRNAAPHKLAPADAGV